MGIGQLISDTFGMVKGRFWELAALWAIYFGITIVLTIGLGIGMGVAGLAGFAAMAGSDPLASGNPLALGVGMIVVVALFYVGYLLVMMAQYASMILVASPIRQASFSEALGSGWRAAPALLLLMIVLLIGYFVVVMVLGLVGTAFSAMGETAGGLIVLLLIPVLVWLGCRLAPLFAVVAVDGVRNPFAAIARAWRLTAGHALTILLASLVFMVIMIALAAVALAPSIGLLRTLADPAALADAGSAAGPAVGGFLLLMLGFLVLSVLFNICYCAFMAVIHGSLSGAAGEGAAEAFA
jgi:hypothetical protein